MKGHTEHRTAPWSSEELARSCMHSLHERVQLRSYQAAEEEIAIKEYLAEVEAFFLAKLQDRLQDLNEKDRVQISQLTEYFGIERAHVTFSESTASAAQKPKAASHLDAKIARTFEELHRLGLYQTGSGSSADSSKFLDAFDKQHPVSPGDVSGRKFPAYRRQYFPPPEISVDEFARVLKEKLNFQVFKPDNVNVSTDTGLGDSFAPREVSTPKWRESSTPSDDGGGRTGITSIDGRKEETGITSTDGRREKSAPAGGLPPIEATVHVVSNGAIRKEPPRNKDDLRRASLMVNGTSTSFDDSIRPAEPEIVTGISNGAMDVSANRNRFLSRAHPHSQSAGDISSRASKNRFSALPYLPQQEREAERDSSLSVQSALSEDQQLSPKAVMATQTDDVVVVGAPINGNGNNSHRGATFVGSGVSPSRHRTGSRSSSVGRLGFGGGGSPHERDNISIGTVDSGLIPSARYAITGYQFGQDYLTRPIDVTALPEQRLAISDSCGGVFITTVDGEVLHNIWTDEGSASSLCYNSARQELLVSVLRKDSRRVVQVHNVLSSFDCVEVVFCPTDPDVEPARTRWVASSRSGEIFVLAGDNNRSAIWKYVGGPKRNWVVLKQAKQTRFQSIHLIEDHPDGNETMLLLTCEGVSGVLLMFSVARHNTSKILREYDMTRLWGLENLIKSPASAMYDPAGNVLILDYTTGKVWLLLAAEMGERKRQIGEAGPTGSKSIARCLADLGAQKAVSMAVGQYGWCFVASFARKRVQAIKYLETE